MIISPKCMQIAHFGIKPWETEYFQNHLSGDFDQLFFANDDLESVLDQLKTVEVLTIFIHTNLDQKTIDSLPNLKLIITRSTGFDHIDTTHCKTKNILVANVPNYGSATVAEHTFALLLSISKQIFNQAQRSRDSNFYFEDNMGFDLNGKTIGIVGAGKIGKNVMQIARGFGMIPLAFDVYRDEIAAQQIGYKYLEIDQLLKKSDILSLHTPLNEHTKDILSAENLQKLKPGTIFINTSRGSLISNQNLLMALKEGIFAYAGLDTMEDEENMFQGKISDDQKQLLEHKNLLYTPHSAFYTKEALTRILQTTIENIQKFTTTGNLDNVVS